MNILGPQTRRFPRRVAPLVMALLLAGCKPSPQSTPPNVNPQLPVTGSPTAARASTPPDSGAATPANVIPGSLVTGSPTAAQASTPPYSQTVTLTGADTGKTVTVHSGDHVTVVLDSTYWTFAPESGTTLRQDGQPIARPRIAHCVPGGGCGTVTATFTAQTSGQATISATRTSCGEAMRCTAGTGKYQVLIHVQ